MRSKQAILIATFIIILGWSSPGFSLKEETHRAINEYIAQKAVNGFSMNVYLKNNLGFKAGAEEVLKGIDAEEKNVSWEVFRWFGYGGVREDDPQPIVSSLINLYFNNARSNQHFHNPLMPWDEAGLHDVLLVPQVTLFPPFITAVSTLYTGQSSVLWAQNTMQSVGGKWSWQDARRYYYAALTGREFFTDAVVAASKTDRDNYYAYTFRALGQVMHLVQDASVPEHVRNDAHLLPAYEAAVVEFSKKPMWESWLSHPITFDKSILDIPSASVAAEVPIARIIDTDFYTGGNPDITKTIANGQLIGIAEYTNANFLSKDTMFESDPWHNYQYPRVPDDSALWVDDKDKSFINRYYVQKIGNGDTVRHLAVTSLLGIYRKSFSHPGMNFSRVYPITLNTQCYQEYAQHLIPRAVGYSAGLMDYFFRGQINIVQPDPNGEPGQYFIKNESDEDMIGTFSLYYDSNDETNSRRLIKSWVGLDVEANSKSDPVTFDEPTDAQEPGKYMLVFRGIMGNERDAVVGRVVRIWREEWDKDINKDLPGNHPWLKSDPDLQNTLLRDGLINTEVVDSKLVMDNSTYLYVDYWQGNVNETIVGGPFYIAPVPVRYPGSPSWSYCTDPTPDPRYCLDNGCTPWLCYAEDYGREFPIVINKDTWLSLKIDSMTKNVPASCPTSSDPAYEGAYQGVVLKLNIGPDKKVIRMNFTLPGNETASVNKNVVVTPGNDYSVNIYELLPLELQAQEPISVNEIKIIQQIYCGLYGTSYQQHMEVDYIRVMDR